MRIVTETMDLLKGLGISALVDDIAVTGSRRLSTPWTMATVTFPDGFKGRALANNAYALPADVGLLREYLGQDAYAVIQALLTNPGDAFNRSLVFALLSALSSWIWNKRGMFKKLGWQLSDLSETPWDPVSWVESGDTVVFVGFAPWEVAAVKDVAARVVVIEDQAVSDFDVLDLLHNERKVRVVASSEAKVVLAEADVLFISSDAALDCRLDSCLAGSPKARARILHGPSASFFPGALFSKGIHALMAVAFPGDDTFRESFLENRGYWYMLPGAKTYLIRNDS